MILSLNIIRSKIYILFSKEYLCHKTFLRSFLSLISGIRKSFQKREVFYKKLPSIYLSLQNSAPKNSGLWPAEKTIQKCFDSHKKLIEIRHYGHNAISSKYARDKFKRHLALNCYTIE